MHRLLKRQLKRHGIDAEEQQRLAPFLDAINEAYSSNDSDIKHLETIVEESSQELYKANQLLSKDLDVKNSEIAVMNERYDLVVNNIKEILFILDKDGVLTYTNHAWSNLTSTSKEDALGKPIAILKSQFSPSSGIVFDKLNKINIAEVQGIIERGTDESTKQWYELKATRIKNDQGEIYGTIGIVSDITESKMTEKELINAMQSAERASQAKDEFLSTMSHEIRTPLNAIVGVSNILMMQNQNQEHKENLEALKYSSDHLLNLINDILDFSKIEAGKIDIEQADLSLNRLISGLKTTYQYSAQEKGVDLKITKDESLPNLVKGDITRLSQVIGNLVSNAIKFTNEGVVHLSLKKLKQTSKLVNVLVEVSDSGIGIKPEKIDQIFEKFSQANKNTTRVYGGTGLGLPISKRLLELMGSQLKVNSTYGEGSTFYFELEFTISDSVTQASNNRQENQGIRDLGGLKVLVAEDNKLNIMVIKQFLKKWNTDFEIVMNGQEAVDSVAAKHYDLVLMDLQMPVMDGYTATREIRKLNGDKNQIPILALTASTTIKVKEEAHKAGMNDHIMKPFNPSNLFNTLLSYKNGLNELVRL